MFGGCLAVSWKGYWSFTNTPLFPRITSAINVFVKVPPHLLICRTTKQGGWAQPCSSNGRTLTFSGGSGKYRRATLALIPWLMTSVTP
eukprot:4350587-Amphidinium_carterae.1